MDGSILVAPGDNVVLLRLVQQLENDSRIVRLESANAVLWRTRRSLPEVVLSATQQPDMQGSDLVEILQVLQPGVKIILCGPGSTALADMLADNGGQLIPPTTSPEQALRQIYQALGFAPVTPVPKPAHVQMPQPASGLRVEGVGASSSTASLRVILTRFAQQVGAQFVLLSDAIGMPLLRLGDAPFQTETLGPLLAPAFYGARELEHYLGGEAAQAFYLYEGAQHNLYAFNIAQRAILVLVIDKATTGKPAPVWMMAKQVVRQLDQLLA